MPQLPPNGYNNPSGQFLKPFSFDDFSKAFRTGWDQKHAELTEPTMEAERQLHLAASKAKLAEDKAAELRKDAEYKFHLHSLMKDVAKSPQERAAGPDGVVPPATPIDIPGINGGDNPYTLGFNQPSESVTPQSPDEAFKEQVSHESALSEAKAGTSQPFHETPTGRVLDQSTGLYKTQPGQTPSGMPNDPSLEEVDPKTGRREKLLSSLDPNDAAIVQAAANYQEDPFKATSGRGGVRTESERKRINALILRYAPDWSYPQFAVRQKLMNDYASSTQGSAGGAIGSMNRAIGHLSDLRERGKNVAGHKIPLVGTGVNWLQNEFNALSGDQGPTSFNNTRDNISAEISKMIHGGGAVPEEAVNRAVQNLSMSQSDEQKQAAISDLIGLMLQAGRGFNDKYRINMHQAPPQLLYNETIEKLKGMNIDPSLYEPILAQYEKPAAPGAPGGGDQPPTDPGFDPKNGLDADHPAKIDSKLDYDQLPAGTFYMSPDGHVRRKGKDK